MPPEGRQLLIDLDTSAVVRAQSGPIGWLVLEAIAAHAPTGRAVVEVRCSSRSLAAIVGVSKDSVARAFRCLTDLGIVERVDHREEHSGRFASTTYRVDFASAGITITAVSQNTAPAAVLTDPVPIIARARRPGQPPGPGVAPLGALQLPPRVERPLPAVPPTSQTPEEQPRTCIPMPGPSPSRVAASGHGIVRHGRD